MSTEDELTPKTTATDSPSLTAGDGTANDQATGSNATSTPAEPQVDYKTKFSESTKEAQRLYQENLRLQSQVFALQNQPKPTQIEPSKPVTEPSFVPDAGLYSRLSDGVLNRDPKPFQEWEQNLRKQIFGEITHMATQAQEENVKQQRINASAQYIIKEMSDPVTAQEAWKIYNEMSVDPAQTAALQPDFIDLPNGAKINPHLMARAVERVKLQKGATLSKIASEARQNTESFVEPSQPSRKEPVKFDPVKHLTVDERRYCENIASRSHIPITTAYSNYWKYLDKPNKPSLTAERLKRGGPVTYTELGYK